MTTETKQTEEDIKVPYEVVDAFNAIKINLNSNGFELDSINAEKSPIVTYKKEGEVVLLEIKQEDITVRHYILNGETRKLKALYVQKNTKRTFKL
jgi:hypothetical protein